MNIVDEPMSVEEIMLLTAATLAELEEMIQDCCDDGWLEQGESYCAKGAQTFSQLMFIPFKASATMEVFDYEED